MTTTLLFNGSSWQRFERDGNDADMQVTFTLSKINAHVYVTVPWHYSCLFSARLCPCSSLPCLLWLRKAKTVSRFVGSKKRKFLEKALGVSNLLTSAKKIDRNVSSLWNIGKMLATRNTIGMCKLTLHEVEPSPLSVLNLVGRPISLIDNKPATNREKRGLTLNSCNTLIFKTLVNCFRTSKSHR